MTERQIEIETDEEVSELRGRPVADMPAERSCMSCGESFASEGWHNRLCPRCRKRSVADG
mgnify:CR=1 FL=1